MFKVLNGAARIGNGILRVAAAALALVMLFYAGFAILDSLYLERMAFSSWDLVRYRPVDEKGKLSPEAFDELTELNPDVVGWITVYDTNIDYPILQGPDDLYYVNRDIYGDSTLAGSVYLQSVNSPDFTDQFNLLYGHHFENGAMFGDVVNYKDPDYFEEHQYGELITKDGIYYLTFFICIETDAYDKNIYGVTSLDSEAQAEEFVSSPRKLVFYPASAPVKGASSDAEADKFLLSDTDHDLLVALSTCDDGETDGRTIIIADAEEVDGSRVPGSGTPATGEIRPGEGKWAVLNLISMILTLCCIVPFVIRFVSGKERKRAIVGTLLTLIVSIGSVLLFFLTENMKYPVTLRDFWTPFMIFIFAAALLITSLTDRRKEKEA